MKGLRKINEVRPRKRIGEIWRGELKNDKIVLQNNRENEEFLFIVHFIYSSVRDGVLSINPHYAFRGKFQK